ncbi:hypothetical protein F5144DRAFT_105787 [Chaetomium tenue]|uniref:Uncharacterized protein n=1 Tax=Chaetomium tenue TaxID=1854479 RepID=A0ACB7PI39_9PEZI|nr:hypothetical protein F5144DRAFT_105787 [Chaetomium globosum]
MTAQGWDRKVFRLRKLPSHISSLAETADILSRALSLPIDDIVVYSIGRTTDIWEVPPFKVATLQLKSIPTLLRDRLAEDEWSIPTTSNLPIDDLLLDTHFEGLTALNDVDPAKHSADCIAISGLASHPFGSWQPRGNDKTFMWLRDAIPKYMPGVRSVLYGYDSKLTSTGSFQSISDISRTLILHLKSGGWNLPSSKPVVFLAHSLGGLVLKDAIVQVADREKGVANILDNVRGAVMFGVPSLGMDQSSLMAIVEGRANEMLVQDLSREGGANYTRQLNTRFEGLTFLRTARILWAYETKESPTVARRTDGSWERNGPPAVLVNPESATCHHFRKDKSVTIPINEDHSNMVKFSRDDATLRIIIHSLSELCSPRASRAKESSGVDMVSETERIPPNNDVHPAPIGEEPRLSDSNEILRQWEYLTLSIEAIYNNLYSPELDFRVEQIEDPFQDTFKWIFDLPVFSNWLQEGSELFWIHGKPGSGKSTLMKHIFRSKQTWELLHNWRRGSLEIQAAFFFSYRGSALQKSLEGVLRSLIIQVFTPFRAEYWKRHRHDWDEFYSFRQKIRKLELQDAQLSRDTERIRHAFTEVTEKMKLDQAQLTEDGELASKELKSSVDEKRKQQLDLERELGELHTEQAGIRNKLTALQQQTPSFADYFRPYMATPETKFLMGVAVEFRDDRDGLIPKLERILRRLLDQEVRGLDLALFFDALDEFDGHINMISRFLKTLVKNSATSATRVKVCFSSRPWESLQAHFSSYPGFSLQDYTKYDIERYTASIVTSLDISDPFITEIVPAITARANGVFLWVKLALSLLSQTVIPNAKATSWELLETKLRELPEDLFEFYELIIERIPGHYRRYTFALLELLVRHTGPAVAATKIRDAVLVSGCNTLQEATDQLEGAHGQGSLSQGDVKEAINNIATWGGGLVETKMQEGISRPQLMHHTVLEFVSGLSFKRIVVGDLASFLTENGHSFHLKYMTYARRKRGFAVHQPENQPQPESQILGLSFPKDMDDAEEIRQLAYHAEQSELTTGRSHLRFLHSIPVEIMAAVFGVPCHFWEKDCTFLCLVAGYGLSLCLRDWIAKNPSRLKSIALRSVHLPVLSSLTFSPPGGEFHERYLGTIRLLLENGYVVGKDPEFFPKILDELWNPPNPGRAAAKSKLLTELAILVLEHGQDPDTPIRVESLPAPQPEPNYDSDDAYDAELGHCWPLHMAPPRVAAELILRGAAPNMKDSTGRTPLDWVLKLPSPGPAMPHDWNTARKYEMCNILVKAGGVTSWKTHRSARVEILAEFEKEGLDTRFLRLSFENLDNDGDTADELRPRDFAYMTGAGTGMEKKGTEKKGKEKKGKKSTGHWFKVLKRRLSRKTPNQSIELSVITHGQVTP